MFPPGNVETITDPATTDGDRYKAEVNQHRAWAQICAHSSPGGHSFKVPGTSEWIPASYLRDVNPPDAYFYNLFACSNSLFTQPDYMAGWYLFDKSGGSRCNGMALVGSAKTGSMLLFENFYGAMGTGRTIGEAFVEWWKALGATHELGERQWYYGMVLAGITTPCLPGMAYAIHSGESDYYLTVNGRWFSENRGWNGYTPAVGNSVTATGEVRRRKDVREQTFLTIEVVTLVPAR